MKKFCEVIAISFFGAKLYFKKVRKREYEIIQLVAQGMTNQEIGDALFISKKTVDGHKANLIAQTGSKNAVNLLVYAIKNKLVEI